MPRSLALSILAPSILLTATLSGCATYRGCGDGDCSSDQKMNSQVEGLLDSHPELMGSSPLTVQSKDGIVYLNGVVATDLQRDTAESMALRVAGVTRVVNDIAVTEK
jgi:osmotically-inducible protein OsmY